MTATRQQVLFLYLENSSLDSRVVGWAYHDGADPGAELPTEGGRPPYPTGVAALADGWRLLQASPVPPSLPGIERQTGPIEHEFLFEKLVVTDSTRT